MSPRSSLEADRRSTPNEKSSMVSFISFAGAAPGACSPMTSRPGRRSITIFAPGARTARGTSCMTSYAAMSARPQGNTANPAPGSSIASRSRPREKGGPRLRYPQTRQRAQASSLRRYVRLAAGRRGDGRQCARPGRGQASAGGPPAPVVAAAADLGRWRVFRGSPHVGLGAAAPAEGLPGDCQAPQRREGLPAAPLALDRRADLRLVGPLPPLIERLRVFAPDQRSHDPRGDDPPHDPRPRTPDIFLNSLSARLVPFCAALG